MRQLLTPFIKWMGFCCFVRLPLNYFFTPLEYYSFPLDRVSDCFSPHLKKGGRGGFDLYGPSDGERVRVNREDRRADHRAALRTDTIHLYRFL